MRRLPATKRKVYAWHPSLRGWVIEAPLGSFSVGDAVCVRNQSGVVEEVTIADLGAPFERRGRWVAYGYPASAEQGRRI